MPKIEVWYRWLGVFGADELGIEHNEWFKIIDRSVLNEECF